MFEIGKIDRHTLPLADERLRFHISALRDEHAQQRGGLKTVRLIAPPEPLAAGAVCWSMRVDSVTKSAKRILVSGRVQQVGYRDWTVRAAKALDLTGWVRNRSDGRVEIHAEGDEAAIDQLIDACRTGPPLARIDAVDPQNDRDMMVKGFTKRFGA
jgi:acylphosphatase